MFLKRFLIQADVAQLVEHFLGKEEVTGSIPVISSIKKSFEVILLTKIKLISTLRFILICENLSATGLRCLRNMQQSNNFIYTGVAQLVE